MTKKSHVWYSCELYLLFSSKLSGAILSCQRGLLNICSLYDSIWGLAVMHVLWFESRQSKKRYSSINIFMVKHYLWKTANTKDFSVVWIKLLIPQKQTAVFISLCLTKVLVFWPFLCLIWIKKLRKHVDNLHTHLHFIPNLYAAKIEIFKNLNNTSDHKTSVHRDKKGLSIIII